MTPIDPPPGLLDKVAEAQWNRAMAGDPDTHYPSWSEAQPWDRDWNLDLARAAWDAVVEGLGLREEERGCTHGGFHMRPVEGFTSVYTTDGATCDSVGYARLVSRWEPQP